MGESKKYVVLSGFELNDNNRGSAALGYGSIAFLKEKAFVEENDNFCMLCRIRKKFWSVLSLKNQESLKVANEDYLIRRIKYLQIEWTLLIRYGKSLPFTPFGKLVRNLKLVAATNGGDGLSDIYGYQIFMGRLKETKIATKIGAKLIVMPQTIGPFSEEGIKSIAKNILLYATKVYIRDSKFEDELKQWGVNYERERDLSAWMTPEPWDINIGKGAIGLNVSGLAYYNNYRSLAGKFENYPLLINRIIEFFQKKGKVIYLIPHSYNYHMPEYANDDLEASKDVYKNLQNKQGVIVIDKDLTSPQVKYVISKMSFFIGTRMHANFAAIYTKVPVFGLAYSYKFAGAFEANGLSVDHTEMIVSISKEDVNMVLAKIQDFYHQATDRS